MLVLHPSSLCDVCLEGYNGSNPPHVISCGHTFCLRCLQQLTKQCCPLCRTPFHPMSIRRLHVDKSDDMSYPEVPMPVLPRRTDLADPSLRSRELHDRITQIVLEGTQRDDLMTCLEEVNEWLQAQPEQKHADLRAAYLLLNRYTNLKYRSKEDRAALADLHIQYDELKEKSRLEREQAETKYQELARKNMEELETALAVERSLREQVEKSEADMKDLKEKYDDCFAECQRLSEELKRNRHNSLPAPPRPVDARYLYNTDRNSSNAEAMAIVKDDNPESTQTRKTSAGRKEDLFQLSPIPTTLTMPSISSMRFRALTEEGDGQSDDEFVQKTNNAYLLRSIQPIPIKSSVQRMPSNSSLLSRHDREMAPPRSLPRGSIDVHMASCSSSPSVSGFQYAPRERNGDMVTVNDTTPAARTTRARGLSGSSHPDAKDPEEQHERWRAQLRDILDSPQVSTDYQLQQQQYVEQENAAVNHHIHDVSHNHPSVSISGAAPSSSALGPSHSLTMQSALLQRPAPLSRASTAALQAERERERSRANSIKESSISPTAISHAAAARDRDHERERERERERQLSIQQPPVRPPYSRRPSGDGTKYDSLGRKSASTTGAASGLTRSLWALQETQQRA